MLQEKIKHYFDNNIGLRVLFLFDPESQFEEELVNLEFGDIIYEKVERNFFTIKHKLNTHWVDEKVFLYLNIPSPHKSEKYLEFPLLDILEANKELVTDDEEAFLEEFGLARSQKNLVKKYMKELKFSSIQEVCRPILYADKLDELSLQQGLIAAFLRFSSITSWPNILAKMLLLAKPDKEAEWKRFYKKLIENNLVSTLNKKINFYFGSQSEELNQEFLIELLQTVRYNQITHWIADTSPLDPYGHLKIRSKAILTNINQVLQESSQHPQVSDRLGEVLDWASKSIKGQKLIEIYGIDAEYGLLTNEMVWLILIAQLENIDFNPLSVIKKLEGMLATHEVEDDATHAIGFIMQMATMIAQINSIPSFMLNTPDDYVKAYAESWNHIDRAYRKAICKFREISDAPESFDLDMLYELLNKKYDTFLEKSNREWLKCLSENKFDYTSINSPKQYDFFIREIEGSSVKTVVIISDALRYEAAQELLGIMHGDDKNVAEISYQMASIPSKTSVGMAQLLPGKTKYFNKGKITIEGIPADGIENRQKILQKFDDKAIAVQYSTVEKISLKESREIFKAPLVYVYHDVIDSTGDKKPSERRTFKAVDEALGELSKFINKLHHTYNVTKVYVTADHGFLYTDQEIEEKDKEPGSGLTAIDSSNRYEIISGNVKPKIGYCISLNATTDFKDGEDLYVLTTESTNRYRKQGVGHQFVHGGGSLQELVVPVINSYRKTHSVSKKVKPIITNEPQLKIVSNILRVSLLQEKKVSRTEKELELVIGLYKDNKLVSNEVNLVLNSISESPSERMHRIELVLNSIASNESFLKLKVFDVEEKLNPLIEIRVSNQTLIQPDF